MSALDTLIISTLGQQAVPVVLGVARLIACLAWLPFLSSGVMPSRLLRMVLALVLLIGLWPVTYGIEAPQALGGLAWAVLREVVVGTVMGLMLALPFHVFHAVGAIVDTQRGAGVGAMLDPLTGVEATELANLLQLFSAVVFLVAGGMLPLMEAVQGSYVLVPMGSAFLPDIASLHTFVDIVLSAALRMSAPVLLLLFLVELLLGVLSRFAQQLNAFSVALAVKSFLAFLALLFYLMMTMTEQVPVLWRTWPALRGLAAGAPA